MKAKRPKLQQIKLKCGIEVVVDWSSKKKCECGEEIFFAVTKNKKTMPIYLVGLAEWDTHFANCPLARKFRKKNKKKRYTVMDVTNGNILNNIFDTRQEAEEWVEKQDGGFNHYDVIDE